MHHFLVRMRLTTKSTEIHSIIKQILDFASCIDVFYFRRWKRVKGRWDTISQASGYVKRILGDMEIREIGDVVLIQMTD